MGKAAARRWIVSLLAAALPAIVLAAPAAASEALSDRNVTNVRPQRRSTACSTA